MTVNDITRRELLVAGAVAALGVSAEEAYSSSRRLRRLRRARQRAKEAQAQREAEAARTPVKSVAAVLTAYEKGLHADVLIGKILEGWLQDGGPGPALKLASMYVDQFTPRDLARGMAEKYNVPIFDSIEGAVTVGTRGIPVDGVISVGEHGSYPYNDKGQHLYPRRRFFDGIADAFEKYDKVVPVFSDKHLGPVWSDAKAMYDRARKLKIPFMAGSSLPVMYRKPDLTLPMDCDLESAVAVGYSGLDIYGIHTLEAYQCLVERRRGIETGVRSVQCLEGQAVWEQVEKGGVPNDALDAVLKVVPKQENAKLRDSERSAMFVFEYNDGFKGRVLMLPEYAGRIAVGVKLKGERPHACYFHETPTPAHPHFAYLLKGIERMVHSGQPSYPIERTLLTSGILDRVLTSRVEDHRLIETPELAIRYQAVDYPHGPKPDLLSKPTAPLGG